MAGRDSNPISQSVRDWLHRNFSSPDALALSFFLLTGILILVFFGGVLKPILVAVILAYLLNSLVVFLEKIKIPHVLSVLLVYLLFMAILVGVLLFILPALWHQIINFLRELPGIFSSLQSWVLAFMQQHPEMFDAQKIQSLGDSMHAQLARAGQLALSWSPAVLTTGLTLVLYLILVPVLLLFILLDRDVLLDWGRQYLPQRRHLILALWGDVEKQIGGYVRGRVIESILVAVVSAVAFNILGLNYALMLGFFVGIGVIIPYVGAVLSTIPVVLLGLLQWGMGVHFWVMIAVYSVIIVLDAYVLVPKLFSEILNLHPLAILAAVIIFGGTWGFWGVFFSIPLAGFIQSILNLWPKSGRPAI